MRQELLLSLLKYFALYLHMTISKLSLLVTLVAALIKG